MHASRGFPMGSARQLSVRICTLLAAAIGLCGLAGWILGAPAFKSILPGAVEMKANTAILLLLSGANVGLLDSARSAQYRALTRCMAAIVVSLALATLGEYLFGWNLGIDELLFLDRSGPYNQAPGRMSPYSTVAFVALGTGMLGATARRSSDLPRLGGSAAAAIGGVSLVGYLWRASELVTDAYLPPVAVHTAAAFVLLGIGTTLIARQTASAPVPALHSEIRRPFLIGFAGALLLLATLGGYAYSTATTFQQSADWVARTQAFRAGLGQLYGLTADTESSQRNYILTGDPAMKAEYLAAVAQVSSRARDMRALASAEEQEAAVEDLLRLVGERIDLLDAPVEAFESHGQQKAIAVIASSRGRQVMDAIRTAIRTIDDGEQARLALRTSSMASARRRIFVTSFVALLFSVSGFVYLFRALQRALTAHATAEYTLRASEEQLSVTLQSIGDAVLSTDINGRVQRLNAVGETLTGWRESEALARPVAEVFNIVHEDTGAPAYVPVADTLQHGTRHGLANHTVLIARDGVRRPIGDSCAPIHGKDGRVVGAVLVFRDMTRETETRKALQDSEARLRALNADLEQRVEIRTRELAHSELRFAALFASAPDALVIADGHGTVTMVNEQAVRLFGVPRENFAGRPVASLWAPAAGANGTGGSDVDRRLDQEWHSGVSRRLTAVRGDRTEFAAEITLGRIDMAEGPMVAAAVRDISERVLLEVQVHHAQRMETVGQLAGGVAHDFNNLITVINNTADFAAALLSPGDPAARELATIRDAGNSAAALTRQLLAFSRKQLMQPATVNLNAIIDVFLPVLTRLIGEQIVVSIVPGEQLSSVRVDPRQIEQVLLNLAVNSRDAMPSGGQLRIETSDVVLDEHYARTHEGVKPGAYVMLAVTDTGTGMSEAVRERIFDPFFTTKGQGKGTGLGLSTVYGIVRQSGGDIWVYSELGRGTTVKIYLPRVHDSQNAPEQPATVETDHRGGETLLLVEDNEAVRRIAQRICRSAGYTVLVATNGAEALDVLATRASTVQLVVTDVVMPGMSARELAAAIATRHPGIRVLFMSGYTDDAVVRHGVLDANMHFISKPYTGEELKRKIRDVLDGPALL